MDGSISPRMSLVHLLPRPLGLDTGIRRLGASCLASLQIGPPPI